MPVSPHLKVALETIETLRRERDEARAEAETLRAVQRPVDDVLVDRQAPRADRAANGRCLMGYTIYWDHPTGGEYVRGSTWPDIESAEQAAEACVDGGCTKVWINGRLYWPEPVPDPPKRRWWRRRAAQEQQGGDRG